MKFLNEIDGANRVKEDSEHQFMTAAEKTKLAGIAAGAEVNVNADWNAGSGDAQILNKPTIPSALSALSDDATHRLVTDTEKATWNGKQASITASGILKGDGSGGVSGAMAGTDYEAPVTINVNSNAAPALGTIAHNNEYRCTNASISTAPTLTIAAISSTSTRFYAAVIYKSPGTTAPAVTNNSGYTAKWQGLDVSSGTFAPKSGVVYRLSIVFDGIYLNIYVSGV